MAADAVLVADAVLAADAALAGASGVAAAPVASSYAGTVAFGRVAGQPRRAGREAVVAITSADPATGQVAGTLAAAGLGNVAFTGLLQDGGTFALDASGDVSGSLTGRFRNGGVRLVGVLAADDGAQMRLTARALTPVGGTNLGAGSATGSGTTFTGSASGSTTLRQRADGLADGSVNLVRGRRAYDLTLDLATQNPDGTLAGTLAAGELGTYAVTGLATGNQLVLLATPAAGANGQPAAAGVAGVLRLVASADGTGFSGRFDQATTGVFGTGRITLTRSTVGIDGSVVTGGTTVGDGSVAGLGSTLPVGSVLNGDGSLLLADGTLIGPDGTVLRVGSGFAGFGSVVGTAPGATGAGVTNGLGVGSAISPVTPGGVGGGLGAVSTVGAGGLAGSAVGTPAYAGGIGAVGLPAYTYSPVGYPAYNGAALIDSAAYGSAVGTSPSDLSPARRGTTGVGLTTGNPDGLLTAQTGGAYGTAFNDTGSIFAPA